MGKVVEINEDKWQFKIKGKIQEFDQPTVAQEINHQKRLEAIGVSDITKLFEANLQFLVELGGEEEVLKNVSKNGFIQILNTIGGEARKK